MWVPDVASEAGDLGRLLSIYARAAGLLPHSFGEHAIVLRSRQVHFRQKLIGSFHETILGARSSPLNWLGLLSITVFQ